MPHSEDTELKQSFKEHFEDFVIMTEQMRRAAQKRRDYRDLKQWTEKEIQTLEEREQAPIVFDQFAKKIDSLTGLEDERQTDPKAIPQSPKHEKASDVITKVLRFVERNTDFDETASEVLEDKLVEGYGAAIIEYNKENKEIEINQIPWDRYYYDPHSRKKDFSDKTYDGITLWMDASQAKQMFPRSAEDIDSAMASSEVDGDNFDDRPNNWISQKRKRIRINQEYYLKNGVWHEVFYSGDIILKEPVVSPWLDDKGDPANPIESECDYVDRDNNRYGWSERLLDVQDEINHRRSKALWNLSNFTVIGDIGAFGEMTPEEVLTELSKGKTFLGKMSGAEVSIDFQDELGQTQLGFYQDAQNQMDRVGINPELTGQTDISSASGIALQRREATGMREITRIMGRHRKWKRRVFRQVWARIKQFWTEERWISVTDNPDALKFVGINTPITGAEKIIEQQSGVDIEDMRSQAGDELDLAIQQLIEQDPRLGQVVETRNNVAELDMDITIGEGINTVNTQEEQFQTLAQLAGTRADPQIFEAMLKLSQIPNKEDVLEMINGSKQEQQQANQQRQQQAALQNQAIQLQLESQQIENAQNQADIVNTQADTRLKEAQSKKALADAMDKIRSASQISLPS